MDKKIRKTATKKTEGLPSLKRSDRKSDVMRIAALEQKILRKEDIMDLAALELRLLRGEITMDAYWEERQIRMKDWAAAGAG